MEEAIQERINALLIDKSNWKLTKFGEVAVQQKKSVDRENTSLTKYVKGEHMGSEDLHLREWGELDDEYLGPAFIRYFEKDDILYGSRRTYLRKVVIAPFEGITSNTTFVIKANEDKIDKRLLPFIMMTDDFTEHSVRNSKGSVNPYINWKDIAEYEFLLPPKDQQAQLAELLWAMDEVIEKNQNLLGNIEKSKKAIFKIRIKKEKGEFTELSDILILKKGKSLLPHNRSKYIGLEHIKSGAFRCTEYGDSKEALAHCNLVNVGDLCYSKLRPYLDKAFIAEFDAISTTELLIYDTKKASKDYILNIMHSDDFLDYIKNKGFGTKMPRVNNEIIGKYSIKILENEEKFLKEMQLFENNTNKIKLKIENSQLLQKSLINQVF